MGQPQIYSLDLPSRCLYLIKALDAEVQNVKHPKGGEIGSLDVTFLLTMSYPIINLPVERLERTANPNQQHYANDRHLLGEHLPLLEKMINKGTLKESAHFIPNAWTYYKATIIDDINLDRGLNAAVCAELQRPEARTNADKMPLQQWISIVRNALSHGGIAYLNEHGQNSYHEPIKMLAFVSGKYDDQKNLQYINVLRISVQNYKMFLSAWVECLTEINEAIPEDAVT